MRKKGETNIRPSKELLDGIKNLAALGFSQEEIANKFGRSRNGLFFSCKERFPEILLAYQEGKEENKKELLEQIQTLGKKAYSEEVRFKSTKYQLAIKHKMIEPTKTELTGIDGTKLFDKIAIEFV